jgi:hypothetical protein
LIFSAAPEHQLLGLLFTAKSYLTEPDKIFVEDHTIVEQCGNKYEILGDDQIIDAVINQLIIR